jgi:hypothetical protein
MTREGKRRKCAWLKCKKPFVTKIRTQTYCCLGHKNNAAQERLRERARKFNEMNAEVNGVMGGRP